MENKITPPEDVRADHYSPQTLVFLSFLCAAVPVFLFFLPSIARDILGDMLTSLTTKIIYWGPLFFFVGLVISIKAFFRFREYKSLSGQMLSIVCGFLNLALFLVDISLIKATIKA
jgi:DMSO/TMAO reductase YedYZ heme-binding membrane subunit